MDGRSDRFRPMREMQALRAPVTKPADVVLGPCPGCDNWQLDYTDEVAQQFVRLIPAEQEPFGVQVDVKPFYAAVEQILVEHYFECPHLRDLVEAYD